MQFKNRRFFLNVALTIFLHALSMPTMADEDKVEPISVGYISTYENVQVPGAYLDFIGTLIKSKKDADCQNLDEIYNFNTRSDSDGVFKFAKEKFYKCYDWTVNVRHSKTEPIERRPCSFSGAPIEIKLRPLEAYMVETNLIHPTEVELKENSTARVTFKSWVNRPFSKKKENIKKWTVLPTPGADWFTMDGCDIGEGVCESPITSNSAGYKLTFRRDDKISGASSSDPEFVIVRFKNIDPDSEIERRVVVHPESLENLEVGGRLVNEKGGMLSGVIAVQILIDSNISGKFVTPNIEISNEGIFKTTISDKYRASQYKLLVITNITENKEIYCSAKKGRQRTIADWANDFTYFTIDEDKAECH